METLKQLVTVRFMLTMIYLLNFHIIFQLFSGFQVSYWRQMSTIVSRLVFLSSNVKAVYFRPVCFLLPVCCNNSNHTNFYTRNQWINNVNSFDETWPGAYLFWSFLLAAKALFVSLCGPKDAQQDWDAIESRPVSGGSSCPNFLLKQVVYVLLKGPIILSRRAGPYFP